MATPSQASDPPVPFSIYRVSEELSEWSPFASLKFHPPLGSDALWKALEATYPWLENNRWRIQCALTQYSWKEIEQGYKQPPLPIVLEPSSSNAHTQACSPADELPLSRTPSPSAAGRLEGPQMGILDFGSTVRAVRTKRTMTEAEKADAQLIKRLGGPCDNCKKLRKKCKPDHTRERSASSAKPTKKTDTFQQSQPNETLTALTLASIPTGMQEGQLQAPPYLQHTGHSTESEEDPVPSNGGNLAADFVGNLPFRTPSTSFSYLYSDPFFADQSLPFDQYDNASE